MQNPKFNYKYAETGKDFVKLNYKKLSKNVDYYCWNMRITDRDIIHDIRTVLLGHLIPGWNYSPTFMNEMRCTAKISTYIFTCIRNAFSEYVSKNLSLPEEFTATFANQATIASSEHNHEPEVNVNVGRLAKYIERHGQYSSHYKTLLVQVLVFFIKGFIADDIRKKMGCSNMYISKIKQDLANVTKKFVLDGYCIRM